MFHYLGMSAGAYFLAHTALPESLRIFLTLLISVIIGYGMYEIISRIPVLRFCVLGIQSERKKNHVS